MAQKCFIDRSGMYHSPEIEEARLKYEKRERRKRAVYLTSGILFVYIVLKVISGLGIESVPSSTVEWFIVGEMLDVSAIAGYIIIGIVAYLLCRHDWRTWWQNIHSHVVLLDTEGGENGDSYHVAWRYGIKILLAVCIGLILIGAILFLFGVRWNAVTLNPASLSLLIIAIPLMLLVSFTGAGQRLIRILSWMLSQWADVKMRSIRYRGRTYSHITPKRKLQFMGAMVLFFCNISPIFIESLWDPGMTNFLQSNQYGNQLLTSSSAGYGPLGGPTNLFLEARPGYAVVNESNLWYSLPYNGDTWWAHSFSANESSYLIIEVQGITEFNVSIIYPDLNRVNYTVYIGMNKYSITFGGENDEIEEYEISVPDRYKQYIKTLVIEPLWVQYWKQITLDFSTDVDLNGIPDVVTTPYLLTDEFFAYGEVALYVYSSGISYNSLYMEFDSYPLQHFHPTVDENGDSQYLAASVVAELTTKGHALCYRIPLDDLYFHNTPQNSSWNGYHKFSIGVCGDYNNGAPFADNVTLEYAIVSYPNDDWDGMDGLTNDEEINLFYEYLLSPECGDSFGYYSILPEAESSEIFQSNWSLATVHIEYNDIIEGLLYIDICTNQCAYENFSINGLPIWNGTLEDHEFRYTYDGWWSILTDQIMNPGESYDIDFMYDTKSNMPKDNLIYLVNGEMIPIIPVSDSKRLSSDYADSDFDGLKDSLDRSPQEYMVMDPNRIWRLVTEVQNDSDTEIHWQIKPGKDNLYALTHNQTGVYYEWNNEAVVSITPALRIFSDVISEQTYDDIEITYNGKTLQFNQEAQPKIPWTRINRLYLDEFNAYWNGLDNDGMDELLESKFPKGQRELVRYSEISENGTFALDYNAYDYDAQIGAYCSGSEDPIDPLIYNVDFELIDSDQDPEGKLDSVRFLQNPFSTGYPWYVYDYYYVWYERDVSEISGEDRMQLINAFTDPSQIESYNLDVFGDSASCDYDGDGVPETSPFDGIYTLQDWFEYYVDEVAQPGFDDYYFDDDTVRCYYDQFSSARAPMIEGEIIDLTGGIDTFEGSFFVPAYHRSKWDQVLDLKAELLYKVTDLNVFDTIAAEYNQTGDFDGEINPSATRTISDVYSFDQEAMEMVIRTRTFSWSEVQQTFVVDSTSYSTVYLSNSSIWFPTQGEVNTYLSTQNEYLDSWLDWAADIETYNFGGIDESLLSTRFGIYNDMKNIVGAILFPGTKVWAHGAPRMLRLFKWENEDSVTIQSLSITEHEGVDYILGSPRTPVHNEIFSNLVKSPVLWDLDSPIFDPTKGGINVTQNVYGTPSIKHVSKLDLMTEVLNDFESETDFGMGWGMKTYKFDSKTYDDWNEEWKIDNAFSIFGTNSRVYPACYDYRSGVMKFGQSATLNKFSGNVTYSMFESHQLINGSMSFDVAVGSGGFRFQFQNQSGSVGFELIADTSICSSWLLGHGGSNYEVTSIPITGRWQTVSFMYSTSPVPRITAFIDGKAITFEGSGWIPVLNNVQSFSQMKWIMNNFFGYLDQVSVPAWVQIGTQPKVLYQNSIYSTRDLTIASAFNAWYSVYVGDAFSYNGTDFFLKYDPLAYQYNLYYTDTPRQFYDEYSCNFDRVTFDFDQPWLDNKNHPFFTYSGCEPLVDYSVFNIYAFTGGDTKVTAPISQFLNGSVSGAMKYTSEWIDNATVLTSLDVLNVSYELDSGLKFTPLSARIELGMVNDHFAYRVTGQPWIQTSIDFIENSWFNYKILTYNISDTQWRFNITINGQTITSTQSIMLGPTAVFGYISYYADMFMNDNEMIMQLDNVSVSTMRSVYNELNAYGYSTNTGSIFSVVDYMNSINDSTTPALMASNTNIRRTLPTAIDHGMVAFNMAVGDDALNASVTLYENANYPTDGITIMNFGGYWHLRGKDSYVNTLVNLSIPVYENSMVNWYLIFGQSTLFGQSAVDVSVWCNHAFIGKYAVLSPSQSHTFTGINILALQNQYVYVNGLTVGDIPDTKADNFDYSFRFGGYWHDFLPTAFTFNNLSFAYDLRWTGMYMLPNGSVFAYVDHNHGSQVVVNYTAPIRWHNVSMGSLQVPVAQFQLPNGTWVDGLPKLDMAYANISGYNSVDYYESSMIGLSGARITEIAAGNLTINDYTEVIDWLADELDGVGTVDLFMENFSTVYETIGLTIKIPKNNAQGYNIITEIQPGSYKNNSQTVMHNLTDFDLPAGTILVYRIEGDLFARGFIDVLRGLYMNMPQFNDFQWRYGSHKTVCYFESMQLESNATDVENYIAAIDKGDAATLYMIGLERDYNETTHAVYPITQIEFTAFPTAITLSSSTILNATSQTNVMLMHLTTVVANRLVPFAHIATTDSSRIDLNLVNSSSNDASPFVMYTTASLLAIYKPFDLSQNLWEMSYFDTFVAINNNNWKIQPLGDLYYIPGTFEGQQAMNNYLEVVYQGSVHNVDSLFDTDLYALGIRQMRAADIYKHFEELQSAVQMFSTQLSKGSLFRCRNFPQYSETYEWSKHKIPDSEGFKSVPFSVFSSNRRYQIRGAHFEITSVQTNYALGDDIITIPSHLHPEHRDYSDELIIENYQDLSYNLNHLFELQAPIDAEWRDTTFCLSQSVYNDFLKPAYVTNIDNLEYMHAIRPKTLKNRFLLLYSDTFYATPSKTSGKITKLQPVLNAFLIQTGNIFPGSADMHTYLHQLFRYDYDLHTYWKYSVEEQMKIIDRISVDMKNQDWPTQLKAKRLVWYARSADLEGGSLIPMPTEKDFIDNNPNVAKVLMGKLEISEFPKLARLATCNPAIERFLFNDFEMNMFDASGKPIEFKLWTVDNAGGRKQFLLTWEDFMTKPNAEGKRYFQVPHCDGTYVKGDAETAYVSNREVKIICTDSLGNPTIYKVMIPSYTVAEKEKIIQDSFAKIRNQIAELRQDIIKIRMEIDYFEDFDKGESKIMARFFYLDDNLELRRLQRDILLQGSEIATQEAHIEILNAIDNQLGDFAPILGIDYIKGFEIESNKIRFNRIKTIIKEQIASCKHPIDLQEWSQSLEAQTGQKVNIHRNKRDWAKKESIRREHFRRSQFDKNFPDFDSAYSDLNQMAIDDAALTKAETDHLSPDGFEKVEQKVIQPVIDTSNQEKKAIITSQKMHEADQSIKSAESKGNSQLSQIEKSIEESDMKVMKEAIGLAGASITPQDLKEIPGKYLGDKIEHINGKIKECDELLGQTEHLTKEGIAQITDVKADYINKKNGLISLRKASWKTCIGEWACEFIEGSILEVVMFIVTVNMINLQLEKGLLTEEEAGTAQFWNALGFGLDIGLEALAALRVFTNGLSLASKIVHVIGVVANVFEFFLIGFQICYMIYTVETLAAMSDISHYSMVPLDQARQKYAGNEQGSTIRMREVYTNRDTVYREHCFRIAARTDSMQKNATPLLQPEYTSLPYFHDENQPDSNEWFSYGTNGICPTNDLFPINLKVKMDMELNNLSRFEYIDVNQMFGVSWIGANKRYEVNDRFAIGAVTETKLTDFLSNMKLSSNVSGDYDGDGLNLQEEVQYKTHARKSDSDSDNITDYAEIMTHHTNPMKADSDYDGLGDYEEIFELNTNPSNPDTDSDKLLDSLEVSFGTNSDSDDTDSDGLLDRFEYAIGSYGNVSDSDDDGICDLTEYRLNYGITDANSPTIKTAQTAFQTQPSGFYKGTHSFNFMAQGTDPWYSTACYGEAYINATYSIGEDIPIHNFVYVLNRSAIRTFSPEACMTDAWAIETYVGMDSNLNTLSLEVDLTNGYYFTMRYNNASSKFEYRYNMKDWTPWTAEISQNIIANWTIWSMEWDDDLKRLTFGINLKSDTIVDYQLVLSEGNCSLLATTFRYFDYANLAVFKNTGSGSIALDSVSVWKEYNSFFGGSMKGDLYNLIEFPQVFWDIDETAGSITFEWVALDGMEFGMYYSNSYFVDIYSQNINYMGPASSVLTIPLHKGGIWYFRPVCIFQNYYFPFDSTFDLELNAFSATFDFFNNTIGEAPTGFTTSGVATVEMSRDIQKWYTSEPFGPSYYYTLMNDTSISSASSIQKSVTYLLLEEQFVEFWIKTNDSNQESKFAILDTSNVERFSIEIHNNYFWLASSSYEYNTSVMALNNTWHHIRFTLSLSNYSDLFINSEYIDNFEISSWSDIKAIKFATSVSDSQYYLGVRGIGISWYGYEAYDNWPEMAELTFTEETIGFGSSPLPAYVSSQTKLLAAGSDANFDDFILLSETTLLTNTGKVIYFAGSEPTVTATIRPWSSAELFEGKLYIMSEQPGHYGLSVYTLSNPQNPVLVGDPYQYEPDEGYDQYDTEYPYGGDFALYRDQARNEIWVTMSIPMNYSHWGYNYSDYEYYYQHWEYPWVFFDDNEFEYWLASWKVTHPEFLSQYNYTNCHLPYWGCGEELYNVKDLIATQIGNEVNISVVGEFYTEAETFDGFGEMKGMFGIRTVEVDWFTDMVKGWVPQLDPFAQDTRDSAIIIEDIGNNPSSVLFNADTPVTIDWNYLDFDVNMMTEGNYAYITTLNPDKARIDSQTSYVVDLFNTEIGFDVGKCNLPYSIIVDSENDAVIGLSNQSVVAYNATNRMCIEETPMTMSNSSAPIFNGAMHEFGDYIYSMEIIQGNHSCPYFAYLERKQAGFLDDVNALESSNGLVLKEDETIGNDYAELGKSSVAYQVVPYAQAGIIGCSFATENETVANFTLHISNLTHSEDIVVSLADNLIDDGEDGIPLTSGIWNEFEAIYTAESLSVYVNDQLVMQRIAGGTEIVSSISIITSSTSDPLKLDKLWYRIFDTDTDFDGLTDQDELYRYLSDPLRCDSDDDGMPDGWEVEYALDPCSSSDKLADLDGDLLINVFEFGNGTDPSDKDTDNDGSWDYDELCPPDPEAEPTDPLYPEDGDVDGDGILNALEQLMHVDPRSNDADGDYLSDYDELNVWYTDPFVQDSDGDGMIDGWEVEYNLDPADPDDADDDPDNDKLCNLYEYYGHYYKLSHPENRYLHLNPKVGIDANSDGMKDDWQIFYSIANNSGSSDYDGDKLTNLAEFVGDWNGNHTWGSNPRVAFVNCTIGISQDWAAYYEIEFSISGGAMDPDLDKVTSAQEWAGRHNNSQYSSSNPRVKSENYNMSQDWASFWDIEFSANAANLDTDLDKLRNYEEYRGKYTGFSSNNWLIPRSKTTTPFQYKGVNKNWIDDWKTYWDIVGSTNITDTDGDRVLDWQEQYGIWNGDATWGLNPRNKTESYGMSRDWAAYWNIPWTDAGSYLDADSDGVKNRYEYGNNTNPRSSDTDGDLLPDKFECKWRLAGYLDPTLWSSDGNDGVSDANENLDADALTNSQEYNFDRSTLKMNPHYYDSDGDSHSDTTEYYLYWQSASIKHTNGQIVSPIVANSYPIYYERNDPTSGSCNFAGPYVSGSGSYVDAPDARDGNYGWNWVGYGQLYHWWSGYSAPPCFSNATIRGLISSVTVQFRARGYVTNINQYLGDFYMRVDSNGQYDQPLWICQGALGSMRNQWYNTSLAASGATLDRVHNGYKVDQVTLYLTANFLLFSTGQINTDYIGVRYTW